MTVRDRAGRRRFILFEATGTVDSGMGRVVNLFKRRLPEVGLNPPEIRFRVVYFESGLGVVRCSHTSRDAVMAMINDSRLDGVPLRTIRTSGTLRTIKDWVLEYRGVRIPGRARKSAERPGQGERSR